MDIRGLVDQTCGRPIRAVRFITLVDEDGIVIITTVYGIFVLGDTLIYA